MIVGDIEAETVGVEVVTVEAVVEEVATEEATEAETEEDLEEGIEVEEMIWGEVATEEVDDCNSLN